MMVSTSNPLFFQSICDIYSIQITILCVMHIIPGLSLRTTEKAEILGVDDGRVRI
jgi:hypothetical protein